MAIAALWAGRPTPYRAGRRPMPEGTWPAAPLAALPALNDVPHRHAAGAFPWTRLAGVAVRPHLEDRP